MKYDSVTNAADKEKIPSDNNAKVTAQGLREHIIQNHIREALSPYAVIFRANVGKVKTPDGRYFDTGLPSGFPDLFGFRKSDGKMIFIEVKTPTGIVTHSQRRFINAVNKFPVIVGVCRSVDDALRLIGVIPDDR